MDSSQRQPLQRARPPYPRTSSRSSTSTTNTRMTSQSANSSTSHIATSPQPSSAHPAHRFYHTSCGKSSSSPKSAARHTPRLSREGSTESTRQTAISSFLQEKLQRERQAESEKTGHGPTMSGLNTGLSASLDLGRATTGSPFKPPSSDDFRPLSSSTGAGPEPTKRPGLGVKEMEQVISNLHKQNFDLKLELFHRREKQGSLETQVETLGTDKKQAEEMNDRLLAELEKRDKAVEEAVAMIVTLEANVEQLVGERSMVRQVEQEGFFCPQDFSAKYANTAPAASGLGVPRQQDDAKVINRMPSFLSDRSENTENLRNVYLGVKGSVLSLPRVSEGTPERENGPANGLTSPTLSVLSESSFASVYGKKEQMDGFSPPNDKPLSLDGVDMNSRTTYVEGTHDMSQVRATTLSTRAATANCFSPAGHTLSGPFQSFAGVVGHGPPLQQMERIARPRTTLQDGFRPPPPGRERRDSQPAPSNTSPAHKLTKAERRESLRRVMMDAPGGVRLHDQNLPPTPDTISTSTLHRMRRSSDYLARQDEGRSERASAIHRGTGHVSDEHAEMPGASPERPAPAAAGRGAARVYRGTQMYDHDATMQRPRSASETTVSHRRDNGWDSDSDDGSDVRSLESSLDIWMRESTKPARNGSRVSPDLFSFPTSASKGGWAMHSMLEPNSALPGVHGAAGPDAGYMHDLSSLRQALVAAQGGPPPPDRRSSLHAQTVQASPKQGAPQDASDQRVREHSRRQSDGIPVRLDMRTPVQQQCGPPQPTSDQKRSHYPPITGQQGPRSGLNRLFRRSLGGGSSNNSANNAPETAPPSTTEATSADISKKLQTIGAPSWAGKNVGVDDDAADDDDRTGATPPPIMLHSRQQMRRSTAGGEAMPDLSPQLAGAPEQALEMPASGRQMPSAQKPANGQAAPGASGTGMRRKWLPGFGRASSGLKNRAG